jgi:predicted MFS family arabinose efflux permease
MAAISPRRRYTLAILVAVYACNFMDRQILAILKPAIKQELGLSDTQLGLLSGLAFTLFFATLGIPLGLWADRVRRTSLVAAALFLFSGMTALSSLARGFGSLLLARIGVGVGEAGTNPASHAMIADLYPPEERSRAMAVFALGPHLGLLLGLLLGGLVSHRYGWRAAFLAAGLPGLVLAALTYLTVDEPARLQGGPHGSGPAGRTLVTTARAMWADPVFRHLIVGASLAGSIVLALLNWLPTFLARSHALPAGPSGVMLALIVGLGGGVGTWAGGWLADRLRARDRRWLLWVPALALAGSVPLWLAVCLAPTAGLALALMVLPGSLLGVPIGPSFAVVQEFVDPRRRALGAALFLCVTNLVAGLGPLVVGLLSDLLEPTAGAGALRRALMMVVLLGLWAAAHYVGAARATVRRSAVATASR